MKIMKVLPALAATALLSGCSLLKSGANYNPKKYKNEDTCENLNTAYDKLAEESSIPKNMDPTDVSYKGAFMYDAEGTIKNNGKVRTLSATSYEEKFEVQFDADSNILHTSVKANAKMKMSHGFGAMTYNVKGADSIDGYAKQEKKGEAEYEITIADLKEKEYSKIQSSSETALYQTAFSRTLIQSGFTFGEFISVGSYNNLSEEAKAEYKFYVDGNVLTQVQTIKSESSTEEYEKVSKSTYLYQIIINGEEMSFAYNSEQVITYTYLKDYSDYLAGEVRETTTIMKAKGTFLFKDVTVKMADISKLQEVENKYDIGNIFQTKIEIGA